MSEETRELLRSGETSSILSEDIHNPSNYDGYGTTSAPAKAPTAGGRTTRRKYRCDNFLPCDPRRWMHRFIMLFLMCFLSFGSYYCYDNPAALQRTITTVMDVDNTRYNLLYSLYSWPNVILSLIGGVLIDRWIGVRIGTVLFSSFVCLGQLVFAFGGIVNQYPVMLLGRFIFGLGGENLAVAQNAYAVIWFKGKELNMVFGMLLSISRLGSTVNMNINQRIYDASKAISNFPKRLGSVLMLGFAFCLVSLMSAVILGFLDRRAAKLVKRKQREGEKISLKDVKDFPLSLWLIFIICVTYYVTVFPFIGLATVFLEDKYAYSASVANSVNSIVYIMSAIASPFCGLAVDKSGFNLFWLNGGILGTLGCHAILGFLGGSSYLPFVAMIGMGFAYSILACALWPLVAFIVPEHQLGTAYGIMQSVQNLGLAIVPIVAGLIVDKKGYLMLETFFCAMLCLSLLCGIILYVLDSTHGGKLNMSTRKRKQLEMADEEEAKAKSKDVISPEKKADIQTPKPISTPQSLRPPTAFYLRNRLLSRMGTTIPEHIAPAVHPLTASIAHIGVLK